MEDQSKPHFDATFPSFVKRGRDAKPEGPASTVSTPAKKAAEDIAERKRLAQEFFRRAFSAPDDQLWL